jgi:hypothetical protein
VIGGRRDVERWVWIARRWIRGRAWSEGVRWNEEDKGGEGERRRVAIVVLRKVSI